MPTSVEPIYLDSSAIIKLVIREAESPALRRYLASHPVQVSCHLALVEVVRAVRRVRPEIAVRARDALDRLLLLRLDADLLDAASTIGPVTLRSLDAIHLAAAQSIGRRLGALVTYDNRLAQSALQLGMPVESPA